MPDYEAFYWRPITQGPKDLRFLTSYNSKGFIWCCTLNTGKCFEQNILISGGGGAREYFLYADTSETIPQNKTAV